ncbi:MAG: OmpA family protein [Kiritimatiellia bacterium]
MKCSTMTAIAFCGMLAVAVTGCKYDDDNLGEDTSVQPVDVEAEVDSSGARATDVASAVDPNAVDKNADEASLDSVTGVPFDQDANFMRCTDVDFKPVYFGFDASNLAAAELAKIEEVAQHLQAKPNRVVMIEGNCDERGSNEYNLALGDTRANAIRDYLVGQLGIAANRVQTKSYGEEKPAVEGQGEAVWAKNRRGEFAVFQHK